MIIQVLISYFLDDDDQPPDNKIARVESIICRRKLNRLQNRHSPRNCKKCPKTGEPLNTNAYANILHLNIDVVLHIVQYLDGCDMIKLYRTCKHFYDMLRHSQTWWKTLVHREEMQSYEHLGENQTEEDLKKIGWAGKPMQVKVPDDYEPWRKVYLRCLQMRRNIVASNFEGNFKFCYCYTVQGGLQNGALTEQFEDLKSFHIGSKIRIPDYTQGVDFLDHDFL